MFDMHCASIGSSFVTLTELVTGHVWLLSNSSIQALHQNKMTINWITTFSVKYKVDCLNVIK